LFYCESAFNLYQNKSTSYEFLEKVSNFDRDFIYSGKIQTYLKYLSFEIFGFGLWQIRLVPFIFLLLSIYFLYRITKAILSTNSAAIFTILILLCVDFLPKKSSRPDSMMMLVLAVSLWIYWHLTTNWRYVLAGLLSTIGLWIHFPTAPAIIAVIALTTLINRAGIIQTFLGIACGVAAYIVFNVLPDSETFSLQLKEYGLYMMTGDLNLWTMISISISRFTKFFFVDGPYKNILLFALLTLSIIILAKKGSRNLTRFHLPILLGLFTGHLNLRSGHTAYMIFYLPSFLMIISEAFEHIRSNPKIFKTAFAVTISYFIILNGLLFYKYKSRQSEILESLQVLKTLPSGSNIMCDPFYRLFLTKHRIQEHNYSIYLMKDKLKEKYRPILGQTFGELVKTLNTDYIILDDYMKYVIETDNKYTGEKLGIQQFIDKQCNVFLKIKHPVENEITILKIAKTN
ncbi:MAG: glycosyltransferase family 39 protein, partial [Planctomycetes bacterium]|nr:glycosyltransferase family 39 protein [Planctomycetota bacterium]